ncbi:hypothetical protein D9611_013854 [Ephemerocybe angulata]|uniref:C2H2-type domain-containing protein n=1 Tax=Ephemerocybe angulata TaxID=980116 RepID=A0A8H5BT30_9AGAR|nr:hypothetical protein D9611_013854 [Tulosesus angulatus]
MAKLDLLAMRAVLFSLAILLAACTCFVSAHKHSDSEQPHLHRRSSPSHFERRSAHIAALFDALPINRRAYDESHAYRREVHAELAYRRSIDEEDDLEARWRWMYRCIKCGEKFFFSKNAQKHWKTHKISAPQLQNLVAEKTKTRKSTGEFGYGSSTKVESSEAEGGRRATI